MNENEIFKEIQDIVSDNPVVVLGSGASVGYGIASMSELADALKKLFSTKKYVDREANECVKNFLENLGRGIGLEQALLNVKAPEIVENDIVSTVWKTIAPEDKKVYMSAINGEEIDIKSLFDYLIYDRPNQIVNVISTNYDKIAEYAISQTKAYCNTGFSPFLIGHPCDNTNDIILSKLDNYIGVINLWKIHGSLDWFRKDDRIVSFPNIDTIPDGYQPCIITPGTNKYEKINRDPHRVLLNNIDECFAASSGYLCIGYGFNDTHVHPRLIQYSKNRRKPILVVVRDITSAIQKNVIDSRCKYIIISSDGGEGTKILTSNDSNPINIPDKIYWNVSGLCEILK